MLYIVKRLGVVLLYFNQMLKVDFGRIFVGSGKEYMKYAKLKVENECKINFWTDVWLGDEC